MGESIHYGNSSLFSSPCDSMENIGSSVGGMSPKSLSPVDRDKLIFGERNMYSSTDTLTLNYKDNNEQHGNRMDIWNTPRSGLYPGKTAWRDQGFDGKQTVKQRWKNFTSTTTFHGIRYIFQERHYSLRRLVWIICVLAAISAFIAQVGMRTMAYLDRRSNVNVQVIYPDDSKVPLPAVTLCNQNRYRVSAAESEGVYGFLDKYYSNKDHAESEHLHQELDHFDFSNLSDITAHQEVDLIEKCTWQGEPCSLNTSTTFVKVYTDLGVCYTINNNQETLHVKGSGSAMGLSLTLNVEQYEYMKGPSGDAGVKILLHDSKDVPLMKDLGFSVAPGTHTLAAIKRSEVHNLPAPYGRCLKDVTPKSECMASEKTEYIKNKCDCGRPSYRDYTKDTSPLCNGSAMFNCVNAFEGSTEGAAIGQDCPVPCDRILYDVSLSYAQLSKFNIESFVLRDTPARKEMVRNKLQTATETSQRMDTTINSSNHEAIARVQQHLETSLTLMNQSLEIYSSTSHMTSYYGVGDIAVSGADAIKAFIITYTYQRLMLIKFTDALCYAVSALNYKDEVKELRDLTESFSGHPNQTSIFQNITSVCDSAFVSDQIVIEGFLNGGLIFSSPNLTNTTSGDITELPAGDLHECLTLIKDIKVKVKLVLERKMTTYPNCTWFGFSYISTILDNPMYVFPTLYSIKINMWYHDTPINPSEDIPEYNQCQTYMTEAVAQNTLVQYQGMYLTYHSLLTAANYTTFKGIIQILDSSASWIISSHDASLQHLFEICSWPKIYNFYLNERFYIDPYSQPEFARFYDFRYIRLEQLTENFPQLKRQFDDTVSTLGKVKVKFDDVSRDWTEALSEYSQEIQTRLQLALFATSSETQKKLTSLTRELETYQSSVHQLQNIASSICSDLSVFMEIYFSFTLPFLNNSMILSTDLYKKIFAVSTHPQAMIHVANLTQNHALHTDNLVRITCEPFTEFIDRDRADIDSAVETLTAEIDSLSEAMNEYKESVRVNTKFYLDNFLQIDLFYKELSYEQIDQQIAFEALSLFSEVGGFMGLLLGASLLTLCELFDYLISALCLRLQAAEIAPSTPRHIPV